jgi:hypothetical protein
MGSSQWFGLVAKVVSSLKSNSHLGEKQKKRIRKKFVEILY